MKKNYLLFACLFFTCTCFSQIVVTSTSGTTLTINYTTVKIAFDAINSGTHTGSVSINVMGNTTETASAALNASGTGSASYTAISIQAPGTIERIISGSITGPLIDLNGADNVTIDGSNSSGTSSLTFMNSATDVSSSTVRFINDATNNTIRFSKILGAGTSATLGTLFFGSGTTTGNNNNTISNCNVGDANGNFPVNAIYAAGNVTAGSENANVVILNNNIYNFFNADLPATAISVAAGNTDWKINGNRFFQTATRIYTTGNPQRVIQITSGKGHEITSNVIGYSSATGTGVYTIAGTASTRFLAIDITVGTSAFTTVQGNRISDMSFSTSNTSSSSTGIWCAINIAAGNANVSSNIVGSTVGTGNITISPAAGGTLTVPINSISTGVVTIGSNNIGAIDVLPSAALSGNMTAIQTAANSAGTVSITNNTIGNTTANNMRIGTLGTTTGNGIIRAINNMNLGTFNIAGNIIQNLTHNSNNALSLFRAIEIQQGTGNIYGNNISNITANGTSTSVLTVEGAGVLVTSAGLGIAIDSNTLSNLNVINSTTTSGITVMGIYLGSAVNGTTITRNKIFGLVNASTSASATLPGIIAGIYLRDANTANPLTVANNMVSLGYNQIGDNAVVGIWNAVNSTTGYLSRIYYNTVNIEGNSSSGTQPSFCYFRGDFASTTFTGPIVDIRNNIFTNSRTGGTGKYYAIANSYGGPSSSAGWGTNASDYNILNPNAATVGYWSGDQTFANWKSASASDAHSYSGVTVTYVNNASDLHIVQTTGNSAADGRATPIVAFSIDIDNETRSTTAPDIGADEFTQGTLPITVEYFKGSKQGNSNMLEWKAGCTSTSVKFDIERSNNARTFSSIGSITATNAQCASPFNFTDASPEPRINYYRLKMTEIDGKALYSPVIAILNKERGFEILGMQPTIVKNSSAILNVSSAQNNRLFIVISDANGKAVYKQITSLVRGSNNVEVDVTRLAAGAYFLTGYLGDAEAKTIRFIKK